MPETLSPINFCRFCHENGVFKSLFSDFIYENEIENYSQMLNVTFGILFVPSKHDKIYTICDECIEKLRISTKFKNCVLACKKSIKQETANDEDRDTGIINKVLNEKSNTYGRLEEDGNKSDETFSESEDPLIADDTKVTIEVTDNYEDRDTSVNRVSDEESIRDGRIEESGNESDEYRSESGVSLRNTSDKHGNQCNICNKTYKFKWTLENHLRTHDGYKCQICPEILSNQREHTEHIESKHIVDDKYRCIACDATFLEVKRLINHIKTHFKHRCDVCNRDFKRKSDLRRHEIVHSDERKFKCTICNKLFKQQQTLKDHMETHTDGTPYECHECGRTFTAKRNLLTHCQNLHTSVKKYSCRCCGKRVATKNCLVVHERTHTGVKPYVCEKCDKPFSTKWALLSHNKVHLADKPHICKVCDKAYKTKGTLKRHTLTHSGIKSFRCGVCSRTFVHKYYLRKHMEVHNGERPYKCDICMKTFKSKMHIRQHMLAVHLSFKRTKGKFGERFR